jgi:hypothetical protein
VVSERHLHERLGSLGLRVELGREIPLGHADIVLLGGQANLLPWLGRVEASAPPCAGELTREPSMRWLTDRQDPLVFEADEHLRHCGRPSLSDVRLFSDSRGHAAP